MTTIWRLLFVFGMLLSSATARGTVLIPATLGETAREAGAIVRGRVVSADGRLTPDRRTIETLVTVQVEETLKGSLGESVQFVVPGGTVGRYRRLFVGAPTFSVGQRIIVFLGWQGPSYPFLIGLGQGVYRLESDADGVVRVTPPLVEPSAGAAAVVRGDPARRPIPLGAFEQQVRALAGQSR